MHKTVCRAASRSPSVLSRGILILLYHHARPLNPGLIRRHAGNRSGTRQVPSTLGTMKIVPGQAIPLLLQEENSERPRHRGGRPEKTMEHFAEYPDPFDLFRIWYDEAGGSSLALPNAMSLSTARNNGTPASRMVLLSSYDRRGFVFHTNYESDKGGEIAACPRAALLFWWETLNRQVRIEGVVERTTAEESDAYFAGRPRGAKIGAWASDQSRVLPLRETLEARVREIEALHEGTPVPRPPHWGGYRVTPSSFEFWAGRENRLHDRIRYERGPGGWAAVRLFP